MELFHRSDFVLCFCGSQKVYGVVDCPGLICVCYQKRECFAVFLYLTNKYK